MMGRNGDVLAKSVRLGWIARLSYHSVAKGGYD